MWFCSSNKTSEEPIINVDRLTSYIDIPLLRPPAGYDSFVVDRVYGHLDSLCPTAMKLYKYSSDTCMHVEGIAALWAVNEMLDRYRSLGLDRISDIEMSKRIKSVCSFSQSIFLNSDEIGTVVFHGSALRGKTNPGDYDLTIATRVCEFYENSYDQRSLGKSERDKLDREGFSKAVIDGIPISTQLFTHFENQRVPLDFARRMPNESVGVSYVTRGPFLALIPSPQDRSRLMIFFNDAGKEYSLGRST